jgi:hypothetical protein
MDTQILATLANITQVVGVIWVLLLGSRSIPNLFKKEKRSEEPAHSSLSSSPSGSSVHETTPSAEETLRRLGSATGLLTARENAKRRVFWLITGVFILFFSSVAWIIVRGVSSPPTFSWYEVLLIGFNATAITLGLIEKRNQAFHFGKDIIFQTHPFLFVGIVIAGPLGAGIVDLLIDSLHWNLSLVALASLLGGGLLILIYFGVVKDSFS